MFTAAGLSAAAAAELADAIVDADVEGLPSHGFSQVPMYIDRLRRGGVSTREQADVVRDAGAAMVLDANGMFGQLAGRQAMAAAIDRARRLGVGVVAVRNTFHFGAAGRYARQASAAGCVGAAMCNTKPMMPAPGGAERLVGNNPIAIGMPVADGPDFLVDMALSEAALGKIRLAEREGRSIPPGWAVDRNGQPTTDPSAAVDGMLLPTGGAKGFGLALAIDLLCSLLSQGPGGDRVGPLYGDLSKPYLCSALFVAVDIEHFGSLAQFTEGASAELRRIRASRTTGDAVRTPGERAWRRRRSSTAIALSDALVATLNGLAEDVASPSRLE